MEEEYTQEQHDRNIAKYEAFKNDLRAFFDGYKVTLTESDEYNGMEEYCGTSQYIGLDGKHLYMQTVEELMKDVLPFVKFP